MRIPKSEKNKEKLDQDECLDCTLTESITFKLNYLQKAQLEAIIPFTGGSLSAFCRLHVLLNMYEIRAKLGFK